MAIQWTPQNDAVQQTGAIPGPREGKQSWVVAAVPGAGPGAGFADSG